MTLTLGDLKGIKWTGIKREYGKAIKKCPE